MSLFFRGKGGIADNTGLRAPAAHKGSLNLHALRGGISGMWGNPRWSDMLREKMPPHNFNIDGTKIFGDVLV